MRKNNLLYCLMAAALSGVALTACQSDDNAPDFAGETELSFVPTVTEMGSQQNLTRVADTKKFFKEGDKITVKITTSRANAKPDSCTYTLNKDGIFTGGINGFRFSLDNTYIDTITAFWPTQDVRKKEGIKLDQRKWEDYLKADRLKSHPGSANKNIMPTAEPVPLTFEHEQSRFTFRMAGQNANGLNIEALILELQHDLDGNGTKDPCAFWAHCDSTETASLILVPGIELKGGTKEGEYTIVNDRYMIGMATVGNAETKYRGGIWLNKDVALTLKENTDYLVTLTPEGYNLVASITLGGFGQNEGYIGVPSKPGNKSQSNK